MPRYAAIDIGSNSIRMLAAEAGPHGGFRELISARKVVRLGASVFREGRLDPASMDLACETLAEMAQQYRKLDVLAARAVGTSALRDAVNRSEFLARATQVLGIPVEVISGLDEARLIHLGVYARWPERRRRLVLDIGGGSAELILGDSGHLLEAASKPLGAVRLTEMFLKSDPPDPRELARMETYIHERIAGPAARFTPAGIDRMIATSATAAAAVCAINGVRRSQRDNANRFSATAPQIRKLYAEVSKKNQGARAKMTGIGPKRAEIVVAGIAVLREAVRAFGMPRFYYSGAGLRDGIIASLAHRRAGRELARLESDQRRMVRTLGRHYGTPPEHSLKVAELAGHLFESLETVHRLAPPHGRLLEAAAYLYNIGHWVSDSRHHKHSLYLAMNSDMPGFSERERMAIANLCRYHRKSMPQLSHPEFQALDLEMRNAVVLLAPLLRIAVALDQSREQKIERVETVIQEHAIELRLISDQDADIEAWYAAQVAPVFQEVYGRQLIVRSRR